MSATCKLKSRRERTMSSSDSSFSSSFFSSLGASASAAAPPAAGAAPVAGPAPPAPTFESRSLTLLPSSAFARRDAQMGSTSMFAALVSAVLLSAWQTQSQTQLHSEDGRERTHGDFNATVGKDERGVGRGEFYRGLLTQRRWVSAKFSLGPRRYIRTAWPQSSILLCPIRLQNTWNSKDGPF